MAKDNIVKIGGELKSVAADGVVAGAEAIYDYNEGKSQATINQDLKDAIEDIDVTEQISGKADKSEMSIVAGTGADADKTTITLKNGTSATVLTQHQDVSEFIKEGEVFGTGDDSTASFNPYSDTVWSKAQTLSESQKQQIRENIGVGAADNEDIQNVSGELKFADKAYNTSSHSGLGRKYLRKNIVDGKNVLTQTMVNTANTIYHIQYDYDLNGQTITLPAGCVLEFEGGSVKNGTIVGNNTAIKADVVTIFGDSIIVSGTWNVTEAYPEWFGAKDDGMDDTLSFQNACNLANTVVANNNYVIDNSISLQSNQHLIFKGNVCLHSKDSATYLFIASDKPNIVIEGGYFYSTRDKDGYSPAGHTRENLKSSNWSFISKYDTDYSNGGITIRNVKTNNLEYFSIRRTSNIVIDNCVFENALMAIFIDQSNGINISNCKITLATGLGSGDHAIYIANSTIININNTEASCADDYCEGIIDIWYFNDDREKILPNNILISNCKLSGKNCFNLHGKLESALILGCELVSDKGYLYQGGGSTFDDTMNLKFQDCIIQVNTLVKIIDEFKINRVSFNNCSIHTKRLTENGGEEKNIRYSFSNCNIQNDSGTDGFIKITKSLSWEFIVDNCKYVGGGNHNYFISVYNPGKFHITDSEFTNQNLLIDNNSKQDPTTFYVVNSIISWNYTLISGLTENVVPIFFNCIDKYGNIIYGSGATKPINPKVGQVFFETTLGKPIWYNGSAWVDATGATV